MTPNWLDTEANPFSLPRPPLAWLDSLGWFDPDLVLFPSAKEAKYRLARRVTNSPSLQIIGKLHDHPDSRTMAKHKLVPVTSFLPTIQFTDEIFIWLRLCDMWDVGGADKAADILEANEAKNLTAIDAASEDECDQLSGSAYRALKQRSGQTVFVNG